MVEKLNNLIKLIELEKGPITLFMLWKNLPQDNTWSVIISSSWTDSIGQNVALQYFISKIRTVLSNNELSRISRVSFWKINDRSTRLITSTIYVSDSPIRFSKNQIEDLYIEDAYIFRSKKQSINTFLKPQKRDPIYNHTINPIYNHTINPIYNHTINPIYNHTINPIYNHNFQGYYLYSENLTQTGYLIFANDKILLLFNMDHGLQGIGVKNSINGFSMFENNNWIGTLIPNSKSGFLFYSKNNQYIGFIN